MPCRGCYHNRGIRDDKVACSSMRHARFMDTWSRRHYQQTVKSLGAMPLVSCEAIGMLCPDFESHEEHQARKKGGK